MPLVCRQEGAAFRGCARRRCRRLAWLVSLQPAVELLKTHRPRTPRQLRYVREQGRYARLPHHPLHFVRVPAGRQKRQADVGDDAGPDDVQQTRRIGGGHPQRHSARRPQLAADKPGLPVALVQGVPVANRSCRRAERPIRVLATGLLEQLPERTRRHSSP